MRKIITHSRSALSLITSVVYAEEPTGFREISWGASSIVYSTNALLRPGDLFPKATRREAGFRPHHQPRHEQQAEQGD
jgi:hypothetical protein